MRIQIRNTDLGKFWQSDYTNFLKNLEKGGVNMYGLFRDSDREQEGEGGRRLEESEIFTTFSEVSLSVAHQRLRAKQRVVQYIEEGLKTEEKAKAVAAVGGQNLANSLPP